jgi:type II secretory pathway pseudopilin PulG
MLFRRRKISGGVTPLRHRRQQGFALIELLLSFVIIGLAGALALQLLVRFQHRRDCDRFIAELRELAAAFQGPEASAPIAADASLPAGMEERLKDTAWIKGSPFGGNYGWLPPVKSGTAGSGSRSGAITLTAFAPSFPLSLTKADLAYIDATLDDDNLATGRFRTGFNGWPVYFVESGP